MKVDPNGQLLDMLHIRPIELIENEFRPVINLFILSRMISFEFLSQCLFFTSQFNIFVTVNIVKNERKNYLEQN